VLGTSIGNSETTPLLLGPRGAFHGRHEIGLVRMLGLMANVAM